jgi:NADPH-dependent 2,4-dienoyl-CoA reductase/sulfur reductase-like enzyme/peroxiredoxin family protein/rhodanese-related sulfurtransferase/TusA-related sulfurtransferase
MKILVVGGVAAGASAAARARRLDEKAEIVILERGQHVSFANCGLPYHIGNVIKNREQLLLQTPESLKSTLNLDVRVGHEAVAIDRAAKKARVRETNGREYAETYDKLVLCPGAQPIRPDLPGIDHKRILTLRNVEDMDRIKAVDAAGAKSAVVIGGGYIGVEMAENLRQRGLAVDLVEMMDQLLPPLDREMTRGLEEHMARHGVKLHLGQKAAAFRDAGGAVKVELVSGPTITADMVIMAAGVRPDSDLAKKAGLTIGERGGIKVDEYLRTSDPDIYAAGDVVEVVDSVTGLAAQIPLAGPANQQGRTVANNICGRPTEYHGAQGTSIVKVFDMTGGCTGASEKTLKRSGIPYGKVHLHPSGHAGYYPGTAPMNLKVLFAPDTGKLLGAQATGYDGVDKRLDVLATALHAGMTVHDLQSLDLAYAPPYGSARDPVNMAGFLASNVLKGDIELWYAEDYPEKTATGQILDVRTPREFETWHIPGARNLPLSKLRQSLAGIDIRQPVFVYCKVGFRSYLAYRILKQNGFTVRTLSGGTMTFCGHHGAGVCLGSPEPPVMPYTEEKVLGAPPPSGKVTELNLSGLQCPGPIKKMAETLETLNVGDEIAVTATDPGFASDLPAWCRCVGHEVLEVTHHGAGIRARVRKGVRAATPAKGAAGGASTDKTIVVFSGDLDKVLAAFVIANGALSRGDRVTMFFTFWGLNALRKGGPQGAGKSMIDRMFGWMMPNGVNRLTLSRMHMMGIGTAMMKHVMASKKVDSLPALVESARAGGVRIVACSMSMDVMGLKREELIDAIEIGGVATFLSASDDSNMSLFV